MCSCVEFCNEMFTSRLITYVYTSLQIEVRSTYRFGGQYEVLRRKWNTKTCRKISLATNYIRDKLDVSYKSTEQQKTVGKNNLFSHRKSHSSGFGTFAQNFKMGIGMFKG